MSEEKIHIKGILIDFGGTIDTNGIHWSEIIYQGYRHAGLEIDKSIFRKAYVYGEQCLEKYSGEIKKEYTFYDIMLQKMRYEIQYLIKENIVGLESEKHIEPISRYCYDYAKNNINSVRNTLEYFCEKYSMVLVSNFYGNIKSVLSDFNISQFFKTVIESAEVGVRKPNPQIYQMGIDFLNVNPSEILIVGDSYGNDIVPGKELGCQTAWLKNIGWEENPENSTDDNRTASVIVSDLNELKLYI